jgi:hypothetical protein
MTVIRLWAQKDGECFDPSVDTMLLDFEVHKTKATEHLRRYFHEWESDEYNKEVILSVGGAYPHFDMWWDVISEVASEYSIDNQDDYLKHPVLKEMIGLEQRIESKLRKCGGELFMEVE